MAYILGNPTLGDGCFFDSYGTGGLISKPSSLSNYIFYKESSRINEWNFDTDTRGDNGPTTLLYGIRKASPSPSPRPLTPEEQVSLDLSIQQQVNLYGASNVGFIKTLYDNILGRIPDSEGESNWVTALDEGRITLGDVVFGFVFSKELEPVISPAGLEEFITFLYKNVFNREPDPDGFNNWVTHMQNGMTKEEVLSHFVDSDEFKNICEMFGLMP